MIMLLNYDGDKTKTANHIFTIKTRDTKSVVYNTRRIKQDLRNGNIRTLVPQQTHTIMI